MDQDVNYAVAKYDYTAEANNELTIRKNEKLTILDDSQLWWRVQNERSVAGYVPSNYLTRKDSVKGKKNVIDNFRNKVFNKSKRTSVETTLDTSQLDTSSPRSNKGNTVIMVATAKYKYTASRDDEIGLARGDQVNVLEIEHDGWCRGEVNGRTGWFPFNYIQKNEDSASEYADPSDVIDRPIISKVRTLYKFTSQSHEELSFEKDAVLEIVDKPKDDPDWWQARKSTGEIGLVPRNYVEEIVANVIPGPVKAKTISTSSVSSVLATIPQEESAPSNSHEFSHFDWFHGSMARYECETILRNHAKDGEYVIRNSESKPGDYSLSMLAPDCIKHFKITFRDDQYVIGQRAFTSVDTLIQHYSRSPIYTTNQGLKMYLVRPLDKSFTNKK